jgi:hypothetical protein
MPPRTKFRRFVDSSFRVEQPLLSLAIVALGIETVMCARHAADSLGPSYKVIPVIPWLPAIP